MDKILKLVSLVGFGGIILGAFLPWAKVGPMSMTGTDGDGLTTLVLGVGGAILILCSVYAWPAVVAFAVAGIALAVGAYNLQNTMGTETGVGLVLQTRAGEGLWLTVVASLVAIAASMGVAVTYRERWHTENAEARE
jgi:hypothetical protein